LDKYGDIRGYTGIYGDIRGYTGKYGDIRENTGIHGKIRGYTGECGKIYKFFPLGFILKLNIFQYFQTNPHQVVP